MVEEEDHEKAHKQEGKKKTRRKLLLNGTKTNFILK